MKLIDCLNTCDKESLKSLARDFQVSGFSKLKKEDLKNLLLQNIYPDKDLLRERLRSLKGSLLNLLTIYTNSSKDNKIQTTLLRQEFQELYKAKSTFYKAINDLREYAVVFRIEGTEAGELEDFTVVPEEYMPIIKEILQELGHVTLKAEVEEKVEEIELNSMENLIKMLFSKKFLVEWLKERNLPKSGNFQKVIQRVVSAEQFSYVLLQENLDGATLRDMCGELELPKSGDKEYLAIKIWNKLMNANIPRPKKAKVKEEIELVPAEEAGVPVMVGSGAVPEAKQKPDELPKEVPFMQVLLEQLEELPLNPETKSAESLISGIYMTLSYMFKHRKDVAIRVRSSTEKNQADIIIIKDALQVGIDAYYVDTKYPTKTLKNLKAKIVDLKDLYDQNVIYVIYDSTAKISETEIEKLQRSIKVIYKTADDLE